METITAAQHAVAAAGPSNFGWTLGWVIGIVVVLAVVAQQTSTVPERLTSVNANLKPVRDFCETV